MTLYVMFAGLGILIYTGVAYAETAVAGFSTAQITFGLQFAFLVALLTLLAADIFFNANRPLQKPSRSDGSSAWKRRTFVVALVFLVGGVAVLLAATKGAGEASISLPNGSRAAAVVNESAGALVAGRTLFQERGCVGCHQPDATGVGPTLHGLFGSPVQDPACGVAFVDESYLREAIENPLATVAVGFLPIMPTFAGLTEEELHALIEYVKSLSVRP